MSDELNRLAGLLEVNLGQLGAHAAAIKSSVDEMTGLTQQLRDHVCTPPVNQPPVADAGPDQQVNVGDVVQLDGTGSSDPDGDPIAHAWRITSPQGAVFILDGETPQFIADLEGAYIAELTVSDGGLSDTDTNAITVQAVIQPPAPPIENMPLSGMKEIINDQYLSTGAQYMRFSMFLLAKGTFSLRYRTMGFDSLGPLTFTVTLPDSQDVLWTHTIENPPSGDFFVTFDSRNLPDGNIILRGSSAASDEVVLPAFIMVHNGPDIPKPARIPVWTTSHAADAGALPDVMSWATVPATYDPPPRPTLERTPVYFSTFPDNVDSIYYENLARVDNADIPVQCRTVEGYDTTANQAGYTRDAYERVITRHPALDGPRGVGMLVGISDLEKHGTKGGVHGCTTTRCFVVQPDGEIITLAGYRHSYPQYWGDDRAGEMVGNWDAVSGDKFFGGCWAFRVDPRTTAIGPDGQHVSPEVRWFWNDSIRQNGIEHDRILIGEGPTNVPIQDVTLNIRELVCDIAQVSGRDWHDIFCLAFSSYMGQLIVADRGNSRLVAVDVEAERATVLLDSPGAPILNAYHGNVDYSKFAINRQHAAYGVEGVRCLENDRYVYFGSAGMCCVRRLDLEMMTYEDVWTWSSRTDFCQIAVSDGTCGPRGNPGMVRWRDDGRPNIKDFPIIAGSVEYGAQGGPGRRARAWGGMVYGGGIEMGNGFWWGGGSSANLQRYSLLQAGDQPVDYNASRRGREKWYRLGLRVRFGQKGWKNHRESLPQEALDDPDIMAYLDSCGR